MLKLRIITALVLIGILLPAMFAASKWPFAVLLLAMIGAAGWEWGRLNAAGSVGAVGLGLVVTLASAATLAAGWQNAPPPTLWWAAMLCWVLGGAWVLRGGVAAWPLIPAPVRWALGAALLWTAWLALATAKATGVNFMLSVFCLVWAADIAAYFGGRRFGRRKLAPGISPGKTWEGVWSGMAGAVLLAAFWLWLDSAFAVDSASVFTRLHGRFGIAGGVLVLVFLAAMSVVGDLFESLVKRGAGAKDSSAMLPGHGGVLDRIDALLPVFPITLALLSV